MTAIATTPVPFAAPDVPGAAGLRVAVLVPCYNEAATVTRVVHDFHRALPHATVYVYDNDSDDGTTVVARRAGAVVRAEPRRGKGQVVRRMFSDVEADVYLLVDGDATYDATAAPAMVRLLLDEHLDMVTGVRDDEGCGGAYRRGHRVGNRAFNALLGMLFGALPRDLFSGYRAFSRRFVKSFPAASSGFEIETEMTVHALEQGLPTAELETRYFERPAGSVSKLSTCRDGLRILRMTASLFRDQRPLVFFGAFAALFAAAGLWLGIDVTLEFVQTRLVRRFPTAILATGLMLLAFMLAGCGLILHHVSRARRELKRLAYLALPAPESNPAKAHAPPRAADVA